MTRVAGRLKQVEPFGLILIFESAERAQHRKLKRRELCLNLF
jgi:hypothetical protein